MSALDYIFNHKSIRKFNNTEVSDLVLDKILKASFRASTTGNMQVYSIVVTRDNENKKVMAPFHFNQKMATEAPVLLTFNADFNRFNLWCEQRNAKPGYDNFLSFMTGVIDAVIAAQNATIAAEIQGLGVCYLGTTIYNADKFIEFFKLPKGVIPITTLAIGYPDENPDLVDRLPAKGIVHYEQYQQFTPEDIDEIYSEKENMPLYKNLVEENKTENLAQIFTQKRYTKEMNVSFSKKILEILENQGFMNNF